MIYQLPHMSVVIQRHMLYAVLAVDWRKNWNKLQKKAQKSQNLQIKLILIRESVMLKWKERRELR